MAAVKTGSQHEMQLCRSMTAFISAHGGADRELSAFARHSAALIPPLKAIVSVRA